MPHQVQVFNFSLCSPYRNGNCSVTWHVYQSKTSFASKNQYCVQLRQIFGIMCSVTYICNILYTVVLHIHKGSYIWLPDNQSPFNLEIHMNQVLNRFIITTFYANWLDNTLLKIVDNGVTVTIVSYF